jgi:glycosyl transferase, family 25
MKTYVINLKKDEEKLKRCMDSLKTIDIQPERFDAVYGKELDPEYFNKVVHPRVKYTIKNGRNIDSEIGSMGAIGCSLSHISLWEKISASEAGSEDSFLILEDDVRPNQNTKEKMDEILKNLPKNWDIVFLGYMFPMLYENNDEKAGENLYKIKSILFGTHAYLINKKGAKKLLKMAFPITDQIDSYISYRCMMTSENGIEGYRPTESIFHQGNEMTGIQTDTCIKCWINRLSDFEILLSIAIFSILILLLILFLLSNK